MELQEKKKQPAVPTFGEEPQETTCPHCHRTIVTFVEKEVSAITFITCFMLLVVFGWLSLLLIPLAVFLTRSAIHRCSYCMNQIAERPFAAMPSLESKIFVFKFGRCQIVVSRIYACIVFGLLILACLYYLYANENAGLNLPTSHGPRGQLLTATWEEYIEDCGANQIINNEVRARTHFQEIYQNNIIEWQGLYMSREVLSTSTFILQDGSHSVNVAVKMDPSESAIGADLIIGFHARYYKDHKATFDKLKQGGKIQFKSYLAEMGDQYKPHHLHGISLEFVDGEIQNLQEVRIKQTKIHVEHPQVQKVLDIVDQARQGATSSEKQEEEEEEENEGEGEQQQQE